MTDTDISTPQPPAVQGARVGEALPKAMGPKEMCAAFGMRYHAFRLLERRGEFRPFELSRPIGRMKWSGEKVQAFLNGRK